MTNEELLKEFENMKVSDMVELTKMMEDKFNVSGDLVVMGAPVEEEVVEAAPEFVSVILTGHGMSKITVIKEIRKITGLGLKESMTMVNAAPSTVKTDMTPADAEALGQRLIDIGATVEIK